MTTENWIAVAAIVATLIAPIIKVILEKKVFREASKQEKKPKEGGERKKTKWGWKNILGWLLFLVPVATLAKELLSSEPLSRYSVFAISISVASLLFMVMLQIFTDMIIRLLEVQVESISLHVKQLDLSKKLINAFKRDRNSKKKHLITGPKRN